MIPREGVDTAPGVGGSVSHTGEGLPSSNNTATDTGFTVHALYAALPPEQQLQALRPDPTEAVGRSRRFILSTNVAETSVTVQGIRFVLTHCTTSCLSFRSLHIIASLLYQ